MTDYPQFNPDDPDGVIVRSAPHSGVYWADITVKVLAPSKEHAEAIVIDAAVQMEGIYPGELVLKGTEVSDND